MPTDNTPLETNIKSKSQCYDQTMGTCEYTPPTPPLPRVAFFLAISPECFSGQAHLRYANQEVNMNAT